MVYCIYCNENMTRARTDAWLALWECAAGCGATCEVDSGLVGIPGWRDSLDWSPGPVDFRAQQGKGV